MAEAIVSLVMEQLVSIIKLELEQEVRQVVGVRNEVSKLSSTLEFIRAVLDDAEKQQFTNKAVKVWMARLKDIMYDADDVLDEWSSSLFISTQSQSSSSTGSTSAAAASRATNKVLSFFSSPCSCFHPVVLRRDIALKIKDIRARLDDVARDKEHLNLIIQSQSHQDNRPSTLLTSSILDVSEVKGRELDQDIIQTRVLGGSSHQETHAPVPVISIVGMGGLGKTTLAQLVFKEEKVEAAFDLKIWACASQPFDRERLAREIAEQATKEKVSNVGGWEVIHQRLCSSVKGKRFLLVLDDVWTENPEDWAQLKLSLDGGAPGSRIIITTRNEKVAKMVGSSYIHTLKALSEDQGWSLFRHIAFQGRSDEDVERLVEIGMEISSKCKGVPLAAKTVANLMRLKQQTKQEWRSILESDIWEFRLEKDFLPALLLSYHSLPAPLKRCFMYTSIFPKDSVLEKEVLVKLWMAQGFAGSGGGREQLEIVAGEWFDDLAMRSFFQDFVKDKDGKITRCKMHDFIHDLAQSLTKDECLIMEMKDTSLPSNKIRHLNAQNTECFSSFMAKNLRTLILKASRTTQVLRETFLQSTCLRALDLHGSDLTELPDEVQCLVHLRYLDLSQTKLRILPEAMCNLCNLQTLKLNWCWELRKLPEGIGSLSKLLHLEVEGNYELEYVPQSIGRLTQLRTLDKFIMSGASRGCRVGELRYLNFLVGWLEIKGLRHVENMEESTGAEMLKKKGLDSLSLDFGYGDDEEQVAIEDEEVKRMEGVLEGLQPNANLERLEIVHYPGLTFPFWMSCKSLLGNVVTLKLESCGKCTQLPALCNLKSLEDLAIFSLVFVKHIGAEFYGGGGDTSFPKLKKLTLFGLEELEDWEIPFSNFKKVMPRLCILKLEWCLKLTRLPALGRLESLEKIKIRHLDSLKAVGTEFLGISSCDGGDQESNAAPVFPCLKKLTLSTLQELEDWEIPFSNFKKVMPRLCDLDLYNCPKLKRLPALGRLESLEKIEIRGLDSLKAVGTEFLGMSSCDGGDQESNAAPVFPCLKSLEFSRMAEWEEWNLPLVLFHQQKEKNIDIMPRLSVLKIIGCWKLRALPAALGVFPKLIELTVQNCHRVMDIPCLPRLPQGPEEDDLGHFPMLQQVEVEECDAMTKRCSREDWRNTLPSHIAYTFWIDDITIKGTKRRSLACENEEQHV